jgi:hypothetical protein
VRRFAFAHLHGAALWTRGDEVDRIQLLRHSGAQLAEQVSASRAWIDIRQGYVRLASNPNSRI